MSDKVKVVLLVGAGELASLQVIVDRQNAALKAAGVLRAASLSDAARLCMATGLAALVAPDTQNPVDNRPEEVALSGAVVDATTQGEAERAE